MEKLGKFVAVIFTGLGLVFLMPIASSLVGAFTGWCVSLFFDGTIHGVLARFGMNVDGLQLWQLGATMGFLGGFLKTHVHQKD